MNVNVGVAAMGKVNGHDGWDWRGGEDCGDMLRFPCPGENPGSTILNIL